MSADLLALWIPGQPQPARRGRSVPVKRKNRKPGQSEYTTRVYSDPKDIPWREILDLHLRRAWRGREPLTGALELTINIYFAPPKCRAGRGMEPHVVKPDTDNLTKLPMDVLQAVGVLSNDAIVSQPIPRKWEIPSLPGGEPCGEIGMSIVIRRARSWAELGGDPLWAASTSPEIPRRARA